MAFTGNGSIAARAMISRQRRRMLFLMARGKMAHHQHSIVGLVPIYLLRAIIICKAEGSRAPDPNGGFCAGGTARPAYIEAAVPWRRVAKSLCLCHKMCRVFKWKSHRLSRKKYEHMCRHQSASHTSQQPRWQRPSWGNTGRCRPDRIDSISIVLRFASSCGG